MNNPETTTETTPETRPDSRGVERESFLDRLRDNRAVKTTIGAAVLSTTLLLAGCGFIEVAESGSDEQLDSQTDTANSAETAGANPNLPGSSAEQEAMMEAESLSFAKTILEHLANKDADATQNVYFSNSSMLSAGGWEITNSDPSGASSFPDTTIAVSFVEAEGFFVPQESPVKEQAFFDFTVLRGILSDPTTDSMGIEFQLGVKEGQEDNIPVPNSSNPAEIKKLAEWFGSEEAADTLESRSIHSWVRSSTETPTEGEQDFVWLINDTNPETPFDGVGNSATEAAELQPIGVDELTGDLDKTRTTINQVFS